LEIECSSSTLHRPCITSPMATFFPIVACPCRICCLVSPPYFDITFVSSEAVTRVHAPPFRPFSTAFLRLKTTYWGALETAVTSRILVAATLALAIRTVGTERPIAEIILVLEVATRARGNCTVRSISICGLYATKSRDRDTHFHSICVRCRGRSE